MPILAPPTPVAPPRAPSPWTGLAGMTWTGWDGSEWDLIDRASGVQVGPGVRGLNMPPVTRYAVPSPAYPGTRNRGWRADEREVFWPLMVFSDAGSKAWVEYDRAFWRTMHPGKTGVWAVQDPAGVTRTLTCRFADDGGHTSEGDPSFTGWESYGVTLVAEQPYWAGPAVSRTFAAGSPASFFGGVAGGSGPPFVISSGSTLSKATLTNPGDVEAYPVYTITGPTDTVAVGLGGKVTEYVVAIPAGQTRIIDTRPDRQTVVDQAGVSRFGDLGQIAFNAPIPAGGVTTLTLTMVGSGTVKVAFDPLYLRAW